MTALILSEQKYRPCTLQKNEQARLRTTENPYSLPTSDLDTYRHGRHVRIVKGNPLRLLVEGLNRVFFALATLVISGSTPHHYQDSRQMHSLGITANSPPRNLSLMLVASTFPCPWASFSDLMFAKRKVLYSYENWTKSRLCGLAPAGLLWLLICHGQCVCRRSLAYRYSYMSDVSGVDPLWTDHYPSSSDLLEGRSKVRRRYEM